MSQHDVK